MQDLFTLQPIGTWALAYSMVALSALSVQEIVYRNHPLTHFSLTLVGGILCAVVLTLQGWVYPLLHAGSPAGQSALHGGPRAARARGAATDARRLRLP
jgi:hypothetical protein